MNPPELTANEKRTFQADRKAWAFFETVAPSYQRAMLNWLVSAQQASTRAKRLEKLIAACAEARKLI
ncbi:YdeI/OmpD-associated family protein [Burkholderiaceae bacterium UC74_6]